MNILRLVASSVGNAEARHGLSRYQALEAKADIFDSVKKIVRNSIEGYKAQARADKDTEHVLQMDAQMLKDIGLTHSDRNSLGAGQISLKELNTRRETHLSSFY